MGQPDPTEESGKSSATSIYLFDRITKCTEGTNTPISTLNSPGRNTSRIHKTSTYGSQCRQEEDFG
jgi:hypothetical protein